jgi:hypothetical protein
LFLFFVFCLCCFGLNSGTRPSSNSCGLVGNESHNQPCAPCFSQLRVGGAGGGFSGSRSCQPGRVIVSCRLQWLDDGPKYCVSACFQHHAFWQRLPVQALPLTDETLHAANQLCDSLNADLGGTEILEPIQLLTQFPPVVNKATGRPLQHFLVILTDGLVGNTRDIIAAVAAGAEMHSAHSALPLRCLTLGIGSYVSTELVEARSCTL